MSRLTASALLSLGLLTGCVSVSGPVSPPVATTPPAEISAAQVADNFFEVVERVGPVAEQVCRKETQGRRCDFRIVVDDRVLEPSNAYQTEDAEGRPTIVFTVALIAETRNQDELAFVLGHEAAHHIEGHLAQKSTDAQIGALVLGNIAAAYGYDAQVVDTVASIGAEVGARTFSKEYELEADALGTRITLLAGYDPVLGAAFFARIPDPGDRFLGTHPPNDARQQVVRRVAAGAGG